jgi:hypothetical protein
MKKELAEAEKFVGKAEKNWNGGMIRVINKASEKSVVFNQEGICPQGSIIEDEKEVSFA